MEFAYISLTCGYVAGIIVIPTWTNTSRWIAVASKLHTMHLKISYGYKAYVCNGMLSIDIWADGMG
jgi:hypothetical protein